MATVNELIRKALNKLADDEYDALANKNFELGKIVGWGESSKFLMDKSAKVFRDTDDDAQAFMLKELARSLQHTSDNMREDYDRKYSGKSAPDPTPRGVQS